VPEQAKLQKRFTLYFLQLRVVSSNGGCLSMKKYGKTGINTQENGEDKEKHR
jgi:hypothetical protein